MRCYADSLSLTAVDFVGNQKFELRPWTIPAPHLELMYRHQINYNSARYWLGLMQRDYSNMYTKNGLSTFAYPGGKYQPAVIRYSRTQTNWPDLTASLSFCSVVLLLQFDGSSPEFNSHDCHWTLWPKESTQTEVIRTALLYRNSLPYRVLRCCCCCCCCCCNCYCNC